MKNLKNMKIVNTINKLFLGLLLITNINCSADELNENSFTESSTSLEQENLIPTENIECTNNYECPYEGICFENECVHFRGLIYSGEVVKYTDTRIVCGNIQYHAYLDDELSFKSSISKCGGSWEKEYFYFQGDQILSLKFWEITAFNQKQNGKQACNYNFKYEVCTQLPYELFKKESVKLNLPTGSDLILIVKPVGDLNVEL